MAGGRALRRIGDPVVAAAPKGVRIRTRIRLTEVEAAALTAIGELLGSVYRGELAGRIGCGVLDRDGRAVWRAERKQAITAVSSSRWAGAITRTVEDQYQLGMRGLAAQVTDAACRGAGFDAAVRTAPRRAGPRTYPPTWLTATSSCAGVSQPRRAVHQNPAPRGVG